MTEINQPRLYRCDVCGKEEHWNKEWSSKTVFHKTWDQVVTVCSDKCEKDYDKGRRLK